MCKFAERIEKSGQTRLCVLSKFLERRDTLPMYRHACLALPGGAWSAGPPRTSPTKICFQGR
eukprot:11421191-Alexandrium_andersonii.AAC.1